MASAILVLTSSGAFQPSMASAILVLTSSGAFQPSMASAILVLTSSGAFQFSFTTTTSTTATVSSSAAIHLQSTALRSTAYPHELPVNQSHISQRSNPLNLVWVELIQDRSINLENQVDTVQTD